MFNEYIAIIDNNLSDKGDIFMNLPLVSICMPVYNGEKYIQSALSCLLNQTYKNIELIISDNASTDSTEAICRSYENIDSRISYFRNSTNTGMARNFNRVIELAKGDYIMMAANDDLWDLTYIEKCINKLEQNPNAAFCISQTDFIDGEGNNIGDKHWIDTSNFDYSNRVLTVFSDWLVWGIYRTEALRKTRGLQETIANDFPLRLEILLLGDVVVVDEKLMTFRFWQKEYNYISQYLISEELKDQINNSPMTSILKEYNLGINHSPIDVQKKNDVKNIIYSYVVSSDVHVQTIINENAALLQDKDRQYVHDFIRNIFY